MTTRARLTRMSSVLLAAGGLHGGEPYFHSFQDLAFPGFAVNNSKLDFGRASGALLVTF